MTYSISYILSNTLSTIDTFLIACILKSIAAALETLFNDATGDFLEKLGDAQAALDAEVSNACVEFEMLLSW